MEELVEFLQVTLSKDFFLEDDAVIEQLQASMAELKKAKLELPAPGTVSTSHTHTRTHADSPGVTPKEAGPLAFSIAQELHVHSGACPSSCC